MTSSSAINTDINAFVSFQNQNRGQTLAGSQTLSLDYNALSGTVPAGGNAVTGVAGISATGSIALPAGQNGNAVIIDGAISTTASTSGTDSYSLLVQTNGIAVLTDNNTGFSETITGASYLVFDGGAMTATSAYQQAYIVETGIGAEIASMYNASLDRAPDLPGIEYYLDQYGTPALADMHQLAIYVMKSKEFTALYPALQTTPDNGGPNDLEFINELYGNILHRTPTATEDQFYVQALQGTLIVNGQTLAAVDRATLLEYFAQSPENQADISAVNGGWLINPANGAVNLGAMSSATATSVLASEVASGNINGSNFSGVSSSSFINVPGASIIGGDYGSGATRQGDPEIATTLANITVDLSSQYYLAGLYGSNETVNGVASGGSIVMTASTYLAEDINNGGIINLSGNVNWINFGNQTTASTNPAVVNGWNSTDILVGFGASFPNYANSAATLLQTQDGVVLVGSTSNPVSGAALSTTTVNAYAINVGSIANDSVAVIVTAANQAFHENGNTLTTSNGVLYSVEFFGQDPQGNTMVWYWRGDTTGAGSVLASDITGGVELVGVHSSSLTAANFHF